MEKLLDMFSKENRKKTAEVLVYLAITLELFFMVLEKSEVSIPFISHVFRVTFLLTFAAVLLMEHNKKEWIAIALVTVFTFVCYRITGRNELLRFSYYVFALRDIDLKKIMKYYFYFSAIGFAVIVLLSVTGILGDVAIITDYGREIEDEKRYVFGFGHPNTLAGCVYALELLWIWIYGKKAKLYQYVIAFAAIWGTYKLTSSRTSVMIFMGTLAIACIVRYIPVLGKLRFPYILTALVTPVAAVAFSVWAAAVSEIPRFHMDTDYQIKLTRFDDMLNNRIQNLYRGSERHGGALISWKPFSDSLSEEMFDMGWVRIFYWYGIIPGALIVVLTLVFIYLCLKRRDAWTLILILSLGVYTVIEATFVSRYIGRNMLLPILAVYLGDFILHRGERNDSEQD